MSEEKVILSDAKMQSIALRKGYVLGFYVENDFVQFIPVHATNTLKGTKIRAIFLKKLQSVHNHSGDNFVITTPCKVMSTRTDDNQWEVDYDLLLEEFI